MLALALGLGIIALNSYFWYLNGWHKGSIKTKEAGKKWAEEVVGESTEHLSQLIRVQVAGLRLPARQDEVDLHDDIDDEIKAEVTRQDYMGEYSHRMNLALDQPTKIKEIMQKGLDYVNKRYGIKNTMSGGGQHSLADTPLHCFG